VEEGVILVDTSAWIAHLRRSDATLVRFLTEKRVRTCDVVIGELELGAGVPSDVARDLAALPRVPSPSAAETRAFISRHTRSLTASGVGWADVQIVVSATKAGARLYTRDRAIGAICKSVGLLRAT
jgi:predicted nucleic acid-binding protein